jgi:hypothetical protein
MAHFEELQELWKSLPVRQPLSFDPRGLTASLRKFGKRQLYFNSFKIILIVAQFIWFVWAWGNNHGPARVPVLAGYFCMLPALLTLIFREWRNQLGISRLDFSEPSVDFVRHAIYRLTLQKNPFHGIFWFLMISLCCGLNLMVAGFHLKDIESGESLSMTSRVVAHAIATAFPFAIYAFGLKVREKRFQWECRSLMTQLETLKNALEERSE